MKLRILFISDFYPPLELGGMEQLCQEVVTRLAAQGHTTHVLTSRYGITSGSFLEQNVTRTLNLQADVNYYRPLQFFLIRPRQERANKRALRRTIDDFVPDVVFIWGMWDLSPALAYWAEQWLPDKVAYYIASYWLIEPDVHEAYWRLSARRGSAESVKRAVAPLALRQIQQEHAAHALRMKRVACVSQHVRSKLVAAGALPRDARVIYNGIDPLPFVRAATNRTPAGNTLRMLYVGGLVDHKGVHTAIEALGTLQQRRQSYGLHLTIVGSGHPVYEARLRDLVERLKLSSLVKFVGRVPREQVPDVLAQADLFLFTSLGEEPIARTVMEAMAARLAVIATPVGGQREMLADGENALIVEPGDAKQLADNIIRLRESPHLLMQLSEAGHHTVLEHFTLERMVSEIEEFLADI